MRALILILVIAVLAGIVRGVMSIQKGVIKKISLGLSIITILSVIWIMFWHNYSILYHPSNIEIYTFKKYQGKKYRGYQIEKRIKNKKTVNSVWRIIQRMRLDRAYREPVNDISPRMCFHFSSQFKPTYNCFVIDQKGSRLFLTEIAGDSSKRHFKLSENQSKMIEKLYK